MSELRSSCQRQAYSKETAPQRDRQRDQGGMAVSAPSEYDQIKASNAARETVLADQGVFISPYVEHYHTCLLEAIATMMGGPDAVEVLRLDAARKRQVTLDELEALVKKRGLGKYGSRLVVPS